MTEEQRQLTMGQIADMKTELENNVKNLLNEFIERTGFVNASLDANYESYPELQADGTVKYVKNNNARLRYSLNW